MKLLFKIQKPLELIFAYLTDMQMFASVHPVISKIENLENNNYLVYETLKLGIIPFSFTYFVTVEKNDLKKEISMQATVFKIVKIEIDFVLKEEQGCTIINENIQFKSVLPVKLLMSRIFKQQHHQLFKNIEEHK
jgi:carbon monoxide dehydrogenase subunit G